MTLLLRPRLTLLTLAFAALPRRTTGPAPISGRMFAL